MKQAIYTIGKEDFSIWEKTNKNIEHIIITGSTDFDGMEKFVKEFDYTKFHYITIEDVLVEDEVSTEGHHHTFVEEVKFAKTYADDPITPFEKMYVNTDVAKNFIVIGKDVFSFDKKTLIHLDEVSTELQLNADIERIGHCAFYGCSIKKVRLVNGLKSIGDSAFHGIEDLYEVILPDTLTDLGEGSFYCCDIENLTLSKNLKSIPWSCFALNNLWQIDIPSSVKNIGYEAFLCNPMEKVVIPEGVECIEASAFTPIGTINLPSTLKEISSSFYYEWNIGEDDPAPYINISEDNPIFYSIDGSLYYRENNKLAIERKFDKCEFCKRWNNE